MEPPASASTPRLPRVAMIPPPLVFAIAFGVGVLVQWGAPLSIDLPGETLRAVGAAIMILGLLLALSLVATFFRRRTTLNPFGKPSVFLVAGPYRLSRNPIYLSLIAVYLGGAVMYGSIWPFLTLLAPIFILRRFVVPFEEARLLERFGEDYQAYCARVRRWL